MKDVVSIIVVADENIDTLTDTVDSLLLQEYQNIEIIIIDRESSSVKEEILCNQYNQWDNIQYIVVQAESSYAFMLNEGVSAAGGNYITFAYAGTQWEKERLVEQLKIVEKKYGFYWSHCITRNINKKTFLCPDVSLPVYKKQGMIFPDLILHYLIDFQSVIVKREIYEALGGMDENLSSLAEYEFLLRLALLYPAGYCHQILLDVQRKKTEPMESLATECYILCEFADELKRFGIKRDKCISVIKK